MEAYLRTPGAAERVVTTTTRAPRAGEVEGRDYHFLSLEAFQALREAGGFLESACVHGNWYGTPKAWIEERLRQGRDVLAQIDVQGGRSVAALYPDAVTVFLLSPSREELERRLRGRGTDPEPVIARRLANARAELAERDRYTYWVVNDDVDTAAANLAAIVNAERCRAARWRT